MLGSGVALVVTGAVIQTLQAPAVPADAGTVPSVGAPAQARTDAPFRQPAAVAPKVVTLPGVSARVVRAGVTRGALDIPENVHQVGWWTGGAGVTSASGTIVIAGHVDSARQGLGVFSHLRDLTPGTRVRVAAASGAARTFVVTGRRSYPKSNGLPAALFDQRVALRLVLVTCTGRFDPEKRTYEDNLVVYAAPA
jgi:hypothetical protein